MIESNQRIEAALAQLGAEYEPPLGWEARVLAAATRARRPLPAGNSPLFSRGTSNSHWKPWRSSL